MAKTAKKKNPKFAVVEPDVPEELTKSSRFKNGQKIILQEDDIRQIELLAGLGMRHKDIAMVLGFTNRTLINKFNDHPEAREAYERGYARATAKVMKTAFDMATDGKNQAMTMFWLKCRAKWREVHQDDGTVKEVTFRTKIGPKGQIQQEQKES